MQGKCEFIWGSCLKCLNYNSTLTKVVDLSGGSWGLGWDKKALMQDENMPDNEEMSDTVDKKRYWRKIKSVYVFKSRLVQN